MREVRIAVLAFTVIAIIVVASRYPFLHHGINFNDPSWYFHFGRRVLGGDVPYRDFVFQVGPLPIYVDAAAQAIFGSSYVSSNYAALAIHILRVFAVWMLARRLAGWRAACLVAVFCGTDRWFGFAHHWSWAYVQLFIVASAISVVAGLRAAGERAARGWLALAGFWVGLVVSARQATFVTLGLVLLVATTVWVIRGQLQRGRCFAIWIGFVAAAVVVFATLAIAGALEPAIQQMFLDAGEKKDTGLISIADALSGGAFVAYQTKWWIGGLRYLVLPCGVAALVIYLASRPTHASISSRSLGLLVVPVICLALISRQVELAAIPDVPRTLFSFLVAIAIVSPDHFQRWFAMAPLLGLAICGFPLASDWAVEMSYPRRGWTDWEAHITAVILFVLASGRVSSRVKTWACGAVAVLGLSHALIFTRAGLNPFAQQEAAEGPLAETRFLVDEPILEGLGISESRQLAVTWLRDQVRPHSTCFLYGTVPILYDLLRCRNPTRIDTTIADFITAGDAEEALRVLRATPPDYVISHEDCFLHPPLTGDYYATDLNPAASRAMHAGLRELLVDYEEVGLVGDVLGPDLMRQSVSHWDKLYSVRLYRRRR